MIKIKKSICTLLLSASSVGYAFFMERPITVAQVTEQYKNQPDQLDTVVANAIEDITAYYENPIEGYDEDLQQTAYELEVEEVCHEAWEYFVSQDIADKVVVFDIDETCLSNYVLCKSQGFGSQKGSAYQFRKEKRCTAIKPVQKLCVALKKADCKLIYISSRREELTNATRENLEEQGFHVDGIFLMPQDLFANGAPVGPWKESIRKKLIEASCDIIGNIGDAETDFFGDNGKTFKLPNYLY